jgi:hypothetical protein
MSNRKGGKEVANVGIQHPVYLASRSTVMLPLLTTATLLAFELPNSTVAPLRKLEPEMVTAVPPAAGPVFGLTPVTRGP